MNVGEWVCGMLVVLVDRVLTILGEWSSTEERCRSTSKFAVNPLYVVDIPRDTAGQYSGVVTVTRLTWRHLVIDCDACGRPSFDGCDFNEPACDQQHTAIDEWTERNRRENITRPEMTRSRLFQSA